MKKETYPTARTRILNALSEAGWTVKADLKQPIAIPPDAEFKITFHAQAVYKNDHSLWIDIRGMTVQRFMYECVR